MGRTYAIFYPLRNLIQLTSIISRSFLCAENHKKANSNICLRKHVLNVDNIFKFICLELHSPTHRPPQPLEVGVRQEGEKVYDKRRKGKKIVMLSYS